MTAFRFRLQTVLDWRRRQLNAEEARFRQQTAAIAALDRARAELQAAALHEEMSLRSAGSLSGNELAALSAFRLGVQKRERELAARRVECEKRQEAQQAAMMEARRRCRLLERLRERRLAEWEAARDKEIEELASELYLARWRS